VKRKSYTCGLEAALDVIGGKWKVVILWRLHPEPKRFGELKRLVVGITEKMLIQQLREMEADGLVFRKAYAEIPPRVEYSLTPMGISLMEVLGVLCEWGEEHMKQISSLHLCDAREGKSKAAKVKRAKGAKSRSR
jgi:DNA-binding HxlR family transcriptional regulator